MGRQVLMICTVGTSLVGPGDVSRLLEGGETVESLLDVSSDAPLMKFILRRGHPYEKEKRERALKLLRDPAASPGVMREEDFGGAHNFPGAETQTILRWLSDHMQNEKGEADGIERLRLVFLPSEDIQSKLTAHAACVSLTRLKGLFPETALECSRVDGIMPLPIKVDRRENFLASIAELFRKLDKLTEDPGGYEVVLCATGGYKAVAGFAMMYAQLHSLPCLYSFEGFSEAYEVMSVPLGYAYASMDEEINMLKAIEKNANVDASAFPQWVRDSKELAGALLRGYEKAREKPYGTGEALFELLRSKNYGHAGVEWADYLQSLLAHNWSQLWAGDQIPETVEHSRRHSKRLMEFTANLFRCASGPLEKLGFDGDHPELLAILIASIYLHDIGHTALSYPILEGLSGPVDIFPLGLFPSSVREVHHLLTGRLLRGKNAGERYFTRRGEPRAGDGRMEEILMTCVPFVAEHHRGYTTLKGALASPSEKVRLAGELLFGHEKFEETLAPLEDRYINKRKKCPVEPEHLLNLTALMRIIDGCDVQADRVISEDYLEYRNRRSEDEASVLRMQLWGFRDDLSSDLREKLSVLETGEEESGKAYDVVYPFVLRDLKGLRDQYGSWERVRREALTKFMALSLANRVAFKGEQQFHFGKHQNVSFVLPVFREPNTVEVQVFPNSDLPNFSTKELKKICDDIEGEYKKVENVLGDRLIFKAETAGNHD